MGSKRYDHEEPEQPLPSRLDTDLPRDRDLLERLSAKLRRLDSEALRLAAAMRQKPKPS